MKDFKIGKYKHYKGEIYDVLALGIHTETEELLVMYADSEKRIWAQPYAIFTEKIINDAGLKQDKFTYLDQKKQL